MAVLRRSVADRYVKTLWRLASEGQGQRSRTCPACAAPMTEVALAQEAAPLQIDVCRICHFIWFDAGEYEAAPPRPATTERRRLSPELALMLEQYKAELAEGRATEMWREATEGWRKDTADEFPWHPFRHPADLPWDEILGIHGIGRRGGLRRLPLITWTMAAVFLLANVVLLAPRTIIDLLFDKLALPGGLFDFGLIPAHLWRLGGLTLLSHAVFHVYGVHLIVNVIALVMIGDDVEDDLGSMRFLILVILGTCLGGVFHAAIFPRSTTVLVGPAAAICAVMTYSALRFPRGRQLIWKHNVEQPISTPSAMWILLWAGTQFAVLRFKEVFPSVELISIPQVCAGIAAGALCWYFLERAPAPMEAGTE